MTKHTPGPWRAVDLYPEQSGLEIDILGHPDYRFGGEYIVCKVNSILTPPSTTTANAHLIAAAPDMLEALHGIETLYSELQAALPETVGTPAYDRIQETVRRARVAIAKATGSPQTAPDPADDV